MLFSDESEIEDFTEFFSNEFYEFSCRTDNPAKDEFYYYDRAIAYTDGKKFGRELGIANFADEYLEIYFSCFDDYPVRQDKKRIYAKNKEKARLKRRSSTFIGKSCKRSIIRSFRSARGAGFSSIDSVGHRETKPAPTISIASPRSKLRASSIARMPRSRPP